MHVNSDPGLYVLAGVVCLSSSCESIRGTLRTLLDAEQPRLHWSSESPERKEKIVGTLAQIDMTSVVVIGTPLPKKKQERARAVCMESLAVLLADMGVSRIFLEERNPSLNDRDKRLIEAIRGKKLIPTELRIDIQRPSEEPMLWMPDIVAGAVGADRVRRDPRYLDAIHSMVEEHDIPLR